MAKYFKFGTEAGEALVSGLPSDRFLIESECMLIKDFNTNIWNIQNMYKAISHFVNNNIANYTDHPKHILLTKLSNVYVLVADIKHKEDWRKIMNDKDYSTLEKNGKMIVSCMLLNETVEEKEYKKLKDMETGDYEESGYNEDIVYIDWIDSFVKGKNFAYYMIDKFRYDYPNVLVLPDEIIESAVGFWADYFDSVLTQYAYGSITDYDTNEIKAEYIDELKNTINMDPQDIHWRRLYSVVGETIDDVKKSHKEKK